MLTATPPFGEKYERLERFPILLRVRHACRLSNPINPPVLNPKCVEEFGAAQHYLTVFSRRRRSTVYVGATRQPDPPANKTSDSLGSYKGSIRGRLRRNKGLLQGGIPSLLARKVRISESLLLL